MAIGRGSFLGMVTVALALATGLSAAADSVTGAQRDAASAYFSAVASGDPQALAYAIHPDELDKLRQRLIAQMREEASHDDGTLRGRLFGTAMQLAQLERLTATSFFVALSRRLSWHGREFQDVKWLGSITESSALVWVAGRLKPAKDRGKTEVVQMVGLMPYGKDWKAILPTEMQAQIEDLLAGRGPAAAPRATAATGAASGTAAAAAGGGTAAPAPVKGAPAPREILALLDAAEQALIAGKCDTYYREYLSPNFRRMTPAKALETLVSSCNASLGMRETLISSIRIVRDLSPRLELEGTRATYDVSNQGLPYERFVLEKLQERWYIAE